MTPQEINDRVMARLCPVEDCAAPMESREPIGSFEMICSDSPRRHIFRKEGLFMLSNRPIESVLA